MGVKVGIYGVNGHQIHRLLINNPRADLAAAAGIERKWLEDELKSIDSVAVYDSLEEMLLDKRLDIISLCSPRRREQACQAVRCMEGGKHVYAEKPCAMDEESLDLIIKTAQRTGMRFHEMAGTAFEEPYATLRDIVISGKLGTVVQVFAQKSYPYIDVRPQDEDVDGGLIRQNAIHGVRMIEHVAGVKVKSVNAMETSLGNPEPGGGLRMAAVVMMRLSNNGVAAVIANYLNPKEFGLWGNEQLRIFGTMGFAEAVTGDVLCRVVVEGEEPSRIKPIGNRKNYFEMFLDELLNDVEMPLTIEDELHPTRMVINAKERKE